MMESVYVSDILPGGTVTSTREALFHAFGNDVSHVLFPIHSRKDLTKGVVMFKNAKAAKSACSRPFSINNSRVSVQYLHKTLYAWCTADIDADVIRELPDVSVTLQRLSEQTGVEPILLSGGKARLRGSLLQLECAQVELDHLLCEQGKKSLLENQHHQVDPVDDSGDDWDGDQSGGALKDLAKTLNGSPPAEEGSFYDQFRTIKGEKIGSHKKTEMFQRTPSRTNDEEVRKVTSESFVQPQHERARTAPVHQGQNQMGPHEVKQKEDVYQQQQQLYQEQERFNQHQGHHQRPQVRFEQEAHRRNNQEPNPEAKFLTKEEQLMAQQPQNQDSHKPSEGLVYQEQDQIPVNQRPLDRESFHDQFGKSKVKEESGGLNRHAKSFEPSTSQNKEVNVEQNVQSSYQRVQEPESNPMPRELGSSGRKHEAQSLYQPQRAVRVKEGFPQGEEARQSNTGTIGSWTVFVHGLEIEMCTGDITGLKVDAMVCPCNNTLVPPPTYNVYGRCGQEHHTARQNILKQYGYFSDSEVTSMRIGGDFLCKHILYVVGPNFRNYNYEGECEKCLIDAFYNTLVEAEYLGSNSIATAPISTGKHYVPVEMCARSFIEAVNHFAMEGKVENVQKIWLVNLTEVETDNFAILVEQILGVSAERTYGQQLPIFHRKGRGGRGRRGGRGGQRRSYPQHREESQRVENWD